MGFGNHHRSGSHGTNTTDAADAGLNTSQRLQIIFLFFLAAVFSFSVAFLDFFHIYLTLTNHTTLGKAILRCIYIFSINAMKIKNIEKLSFF